MARFQTKVADLLEKETGSSPLPEWAEINWSALGRKVGVSGPTLKRWCEARVGSDEYLSTVDGEVLGNLMRYFNVTPGEIVVVVSEDGEVDPLVIQKAALAAAAV